MAGSSTFAAMHEAEPGTFYLTDFLAKHFDALVWGSLGLDRHPELRDMYFGNYRRVVLLSQTDDAGGRRRRPAGGRDARPRVRARARRPPAVRRRGVGQPCAEGRLMPRRESGRERGRHHLLARHPGPGQRPERARAAPGAAVVEVPACRRPRQAQGRHLHRRGRHRPVAARPSEPCRRPRARGRGAGGGARGRVLEGVPRQARLRRRLRGRHDRRRRRSRRAAGARGARRDRGRTE